LNLSFTSSYNSKKAKYAVRLASLRGSEVPTSISTNAFDMLDEWFKEGSEEYFEKLMYKK